MNTELERCRQRYRQIIGALPCAMVHGEILVDGRGEPSDYSVKDINHAFEVLTGLSREKVIGRRINGLFSIASRADDIEVFSRVAISGDPIEMEFFSPIFAVHFRLFCFSPGEGDFVAFLTDLTSDKKNRERLEFLRDFANSTADEFFILDPEGRFVLGNRAVGDQLDLPQDRIPGLNLSKLNPIADENWWRTLWRSLLKKGSLQFETEHLGRDGRTYPVELSIDLMGNRKKTFAAVVAKNISSKRALSSALLKDRRYAEKAAHAAGYMIWLIDSSGEFRPILGGDDDFASGPADSVFFSRVQWQDRDELRQRISSVAEGSHDFRMRTGGQWKYARAVWSRVEANCTAGICYSIPGSGFSGQGSSSPAMDTYCMMAEAISARLESLRESVQAGDRGKALQIIDSVRSEYSLVSGNRSFNGTIRFDPFLEEKAGLFRQLLDQGISLEVTSGSGATGLIGHSTLENLCIRLLMVVQSTGLVNRIVIRTRRNQGSAGLIFEVHGRAGIQEELDSRFIQEAENVPGLASVYAMVRAARGKAVYSTRDSLVEFSLWFPGVRMDGDTPAILVSLSDSIDAARAYAALREQGFSVGIESSPADLPRRIGEEGTGILLISAAFLDHRSGPTRLNLGATVTVQVGGEPPEPPARYLPEGFRTSELVRLVGEILAKAEKPREEGLREGILWTEPHLSPPLF